MTFIISNTGANNTQGTVAKFSKSGSVKVGGSFRNSGDVEVDTKANLNIVGDLLNTGNFSIKDYVAVEKYKLIEKAIIELEGEPRHLLQESLTALKTDQDSIADSKFKRFLSYVKNHPEIITDSVQIVLQLFTTK